MSAMTQYLQKSLLDHTLGLGTYTPAANLYMSLHTASPGEAGSRANEVSTSGTNYARQLLTGKMGATVLASGRSTLTGVITTNAALTDWGTITYLGVDDDLTAGNMIMYGAPTTAQTISVGEAFQLTPGQFAMRFQ